MKLQNTKYLGMFSAHYNYILYVEKKKAAEFNIHFFLHTQKLVLLLAPIPGRPEGVTTCHFLFQLIFKHYLFRHDIIWY